MSDSWLPCRTASIITNRCTEVDCRAVLPTSWALICVMADCCAEPPAYLLIEVRRLTAVQHPRHHELRCLTVNCRAEPRGYLVLDVQKFTAAQNIHKREPLYMSDSWLQHRTISIFIVRCTEVYCSAGPPSLSCGTVDRSARPFALEFKCSSWLPCMW